MIPIIDIVTFLAPVATEAPVIDDLHIFKSNGMCKDNKYGFLKPSTRSSVELLVQEPGKEGNYVVFASFYAMLQYILNVWSQGKQLVLFS